jgi:hypothetical protein
MVSHLTKKHPKAEHLMDRHPMDRLLMDRLRATHRKAGLRTDRHPEILPEADLAAEAAVQI